MENFDHRSILVDSGTIVQCDNQLKNSHPEQCKGKKQKENNNFFVSGTAHSQRKLDPLVCNNEAMPAEEV